MTLSMYWNTHSKQTKTSFKVSELLLNLIEHLQALHSDADLKSDSEMSIPHSPTFSVSNLLQVNTYTNKDETISMSCCLINFHRPLTSKKNWFMLWLFDSSKCAATLEKSTNSKFIWWFAISTFTYNSVLN